MPIKNNAGTSSNSMCHTGSQIFIGAMILYALHMFFVVQEVYRWSASRVGVIVDSFGGLVLFLIIVPIGWILIAVGYRQLNHCAKMVKTKADQQHLTSWKNKSGALLLALAIISMIFNFALMALYIIFALTLLSTIGQFIIGLRLRTWTAPDYSMPTEVMIPGR